MGNGIFKKIGKWLLLLILVLFLGFVFACIFYIVNLIRTGQWQSQQLLTSSKQEDTKVLQTMTKDSYWLGAANPKVTIIEFGDFACPHCEEAFPTIREISIKYKNTVKVIFKDFPVVSSDSITLALAGRCAGEQGLFWPMYDKLYLNQNTLSSESDSIKLEEELTESAKEIGVNINRFTSCLDNKKYQASVNQDYQDGISLQVSGTPTWFINGYKVEGVPPHDTFVKMVENLLK